MRKYGDWFEMSEQKEIMINGTIRLIDKNLYGMWELYLDDEDIKWLEKKKWTKKNSGRTIQSFKEN